MPEVADLRVKISLDGADKVASGLQQADRSVSSFASNAGRLGGAVTSVGAQFLAFGVVAGGAVVAGLGAAVGKAADFEQGMSRVQAASGASASEMSRLGAAAIALGSDTQLAGIGATDAAKAMEELAKGGVSVSDQLGGATKGALLLASSGSIEVGTAAGIATKAMNIFGLSGTEVAHVADLMSAGANKSATDVGQLGAAFNQSAAVAKSAGLSIEELTGTLAFMAQRGMEGSDAGTSLKTALLALQAPTDVAAKTMQDLGINVRDSNGQMLPFADIADVLKSRLSGLSDAQRDAALKTIFGNDAIRVGIALYEGGGGAIRGWTANVNDAGNAARTGATINDNLKGSMSQLGAVLETGAIQFGSKLVPVVRTASEEIAKFVQSVMQSPQATAAIDSFATSASAAIQRFFTTIKDPAFQNAAKEWGTAALDVGRAVGGLASSIGSTLGPPLREAVTWFNGLDEAGKKNVISFGLIAASAMKFRDELGTLKSVVGGVVGAFGEKLAAKKLLTGANEGLAKSAGNTATAMKGAGSAATTFGTAAAGVATFVGSAAVVIGGSVIAAGALTMGFVKLANAMDSGGERARENEQAWTAAGMAIAQGGTATNGAVDGFTRLVVASGQQSNSLTALVPLWNQYYDGLVRSGQSTEGLARAYLGNLGPMQAFSAALQAQGYELGNAGNKGNEFNTGLAGIGVGARAIASAIPPATAALQGGAAAIGDMAGRSVSLGAGLGAATVSLGAISQRMMASTAPAQAFNAQIAGLQSQIANYSATAAIAQSDTGEFGTAMGSASSNINGYGQALTQVSGRMTATSTEAQGLQGYLGVLQGRWNELNVATDNGKNATAEQQAEYAKLSPAIDYLNGRMGVLSETQVDNTVKAVANYEGLQNSAAAYTTASAGADQLATSSTTSANALRVSEIAAIGASTKYDELGQVMVAVPTTVASTVTTNAPQATTDFQGLVTAATDVPANTAANVTTDAPTAASVFGDLAADIQGIPQDTPANITTDAGAAASQFGDLVSDIQGIPQDTPANITTDAGAAASQFSDLVSDIQSIPQDTPANVSTDAGAAASQFSDLVSNMQGIPQDTPANVSTDAAAAASQFGDLAADMQGIPQDTPANVTTDAPTASAQFADLTGAAVAVPGVTPANVATDAPTATQEFLDLTGAAVAVPGVTPANVATDAPTATQEFFDLTGAAEAVPGVTEANVTTDAPTTTQEFFDLTEAAEAVPGVTEANATTDAPTATQEFLDLAGAVDGVPNSINVTAHVDTSAALAAIQHLRDNMPSSPAKEGAFKASNFPNFGTTLDSFPPAIDSAIGQVTRLGVAMDSEQSELTKNVSAMLGLAAGGNVTRPTYGLSGESGPGAVVPLHRYNGGNSDGMGSGSGGGDTFNITVTGNTMLGREPEVARQLAAIIAPELRRQVRF